MVPSTVRSGPASVPCIRLISNNDDVANRPSETHITREPSTHGVPGSYVKAKKGPSAGSLAKTTAEGQPTTIKLNITLHKQMIDLLENAGTKGMTLNVSIYCRPSLYTQ